MTNQPKKWGKLGAQYKDLLGDLILLVVLHGAVQGQRQPAKVDLYGVAEPQHQPGPE